MNRRDVLTVTGGITLSTTLAGCFSVEQNESGGKPTETNLEVQATTTNRQPLTTTASWISARPTL
ncbi:hypothetical protein [Halonotius sp. GCM10025705]|uniref:hypothetical protein n=1 Tax=Halonotius sp. GCM10025705 TaxID=3252678 RepID=UPI00360F2EE2